MPVQDNFIERVIEEYYKLFNNYIGTCFECCEAEDLMIKQVNFLLQALEEQAKEQLENVKYWVQDWWGEGMPYGVDGILKKLSSGNINHRCFFNEGRDEFVKEILDCLPEKLKMKYAIKAKSDAGAGHVIGFNDCRDQFLQNLRDKKLIK